MNFKTIHIKKEGWHIEQLLKGNCPILEWFLEAEKASAIPIKLIFSKKYYSSFVMVRAEHIDLSTIDKSFTFYSDLGNFVIFKGDE